MIRFYSVNTVIVTACPTVSTVERVIVVLAISTITVCGLITVWVRPIITISLLVLSQPFAIQ